MMAASTAPPLVAEQGDFCKLMVETAISKLPKVLRECVLLEWKDAPGCNFARLCHNAKGKGVEQEYLDKVPHEVLKEPCFKAIGLF